MPNRYHAFIFDMDGTLFDTEPVHREAWRHVFGKYNIQVSDMEIIQHNGSAPWQVAQNIIKSRQIALSPCSIAEEKSVFIEELLLSAPIAMLPAAEVVKQLYGKYPLGLGTGSGLSTAMLLLNRFKFTHYFDCIVSADDVTNHKPAPDTFQQCARLLDTAPDKCIVFEDSHYGLLAGEKAGMNTIDINGKNTEELFTLLR